MQVEVRVVAQRLTLAVASVLQSIDVTPLIIIPQRPNLPSFRAAFFALRFIHQAASFARNLFFMRDLLNDLFKCGDRILHESDVKALIGRMQIIDRSK